MICYSLAQNKYLTPSPKERIGLDNALWVPLGIIFWILCWTLPLWIETDGFWKFLYIYPDSHLSSSIIEKLVSSGNINGLSLTPGSGFKLPLDYSTRVRISSIGVSSIVIPICLAAGTLKHAENTRYYINKCHEPKPGFNLKVITAGPLILYAINEIIPLTSLSKIPGIYIVGIGLYPWMTLFFCTIYSVSSFHAFEFIRRSRAKNTH